MPFRLREDVIFDAGRIARRVEEIGRTVSDDDRGRDLVRLGVLCGSLLFFADGLHPCSSGRRGRPRREYARRPDGPGSFRVPCAGRPDQTGGDVPLVEDIVDTGRTLRYILETLRRRSPGTLEICALLLE